MSGVNTSKTFDALAIRDTNAHNGATVYNGEAAIKTIIIENSLNQAVSLQCQASANADFSNSFNLGSAIDTTATTNTFETCDSYFPYWRVVATCGTSPTTGTLTVFVYGVKT